MRAPAVIFAKAEAGNEAGRHQRMDMTKQALNKLLLGVRRRQDRRERFVKLRSGDYREIAALATSTDRSVAEEPSLRQAVTIMSHMQAQRRSIEQENT
jgi:hypothetical protein